jgi:hypothetical protein
VTPGPRDESVAQRDDRNLAELLTEVRIAGLGVQVLFGFLLALPFTTRFGRLSVAQMDLYVTALLLSAVATALLLGPVAYHRVVFRQQQKEGLVRAANVLALAGLAAVGLAIWSAVTLILSVVLPGSPAGAISAVFFCLLAGLWFAFPLARRR